MAKRRSSEKTKKIAAASLGGVLVIVFVYQIFLSGPAPRPTRNPQAGNKSAGTTAPTNSTPSAPSAPQKGSLSASARQEALVHELLTDMTPLNLSLIQKTGGKAESGSRGNIFGYYIPPPPPPAKAPDPPPITLVGVQPQSAVAGTPRPFTLIVTGNKIPEDAQILLDGSPRQTKRMGETQLSTEMTPGDYSYPRNINIDVKSKSDPATSYSNPVTFVVQASPEPQFIYKGRLGALNQPQSNYAVFELTSTKEIKRGKVGDTIMGAWRIDSIAADAVEVTHTQFGMKKRIALQDKLR